MSMIRLHSAPHLTGVVGERIASARGFRRWTQDELLDRMSAIDLEHVPSRRTLGKWENGVTSPNVPQLVMLAEALDFPPEAFVAGLGASVAGPDDGPDDDGTYSGQVEVGTRRFFPTVIAVDFAQQAA